MELTNPQNEQFDIGRAAIFRYAPYDDEGLAADGSWDGTTDLFAGMEHIATSEGEVMFEPNPEFSDLKAETTGPAILKRYLSGESPTFDIGVYPDPDKAAIFSPTGTASMGTMRRRLVRSHTLWIVPEQLFLATLPDGRQVEAEVTFDGTDWLKDGDAFTDEDTRLLNSSVVIWKAQFDRALPRYSHEDGGKSLRTVPVTVLQDLTKPDGAQLLLAMHEAPLFEVDFVPTP